MTEVTISPKQLRKFVERILGLKEHQDLAAILYPQGLRRREGRRARQAGDRSARHVSSQEGAGTPRSSRQTSPFSSSAHKTYVRPPRTRMRVRKTVARLAGGIPQHYPTRRCSRQELALGLIDAAEFDGETYSTSPSMSASRCIEASRIRQRGFSRPDMVNFAPSVAILISAPDRGATIATPAVAQQMSGRSTLTVSLISSGQGEVEEATIRRHQIPSKFHHAPPDLAPHRSVAAGVVSRRRTSRSLLSRQRSFLRAWRDGRQQLGYPVSRHQSRYRARFYQ